MKQVVLVAATILGVGMAMLALWQMSEAIWLLVLSLAIAAALTPDIQRMAQRGISRGRAIGLSYLLGFGVVLGFIAVLGVLVYSEVALVMSRVPAWYEQTRQTLQTQTDWRAQVGQSLPLLNSFAQVTGEGEETTIKWVTWALGSLVGTAILIVAAVSLAFYWLVDEQRIIRLWLSLLPLPVRVPARAMWESVYQEVGHFLRGEILLVMLSMVGLMCAYAITGLTAPATLALVGGLLMVVPVLGVPLAMIPGAVVALSFGYETFLFTVGLSLVVLLIIKLVIGPRLFRHTIRVNPVLQVIVIMALAELAGIFGVLLAPPLAAAIQTGARIWVTEFRQMVQRSKSARIQELQLQLDHLQLRVTPEYTGYEQYHALLQRAHNLMRATAEHIPHDEPTLEVVGPASADPQKVSVEQRA